MPVFPCNFYSDSSVLRKIIMSENFSQGQLSRIHIDLRLSQRRPVPESHQIFSFLFPVFVLVSPRTLKVISPKAQAMKRIPPRTMYWVPILERK